MAKPVASSAKGATSYRDVVVNRKAYHDYEVLDKLEAGISLTGSEIKSIRDGKMNLQEAYARPEKGEMWLIGAHIAPYDAASYLGHEPRRSRRLLIHRAQLREFERQVNQKGLTIVPLRVYLKDGMAKVELGLARGRREYDKRDAIAKREAQRDIERALRQRTVGSRK